MIELPTPPEQRGDQSTGEQRREKRRGEQRSEKRRVR
jgi:hypothetical protein